MSRRKKHHLEDEAEESGELNLTPYLDIITTLVIFLIFTFQVVIEFRLIELLPPAYTGSQAKNPSENPDKPEVTLSLLITTEGYRLVTNLPEMGTVDVPKRAGEYDNVKLPQELDRVKRTLSIGESIVVTAADNIEYRYVVAAMDACREFEGHRLFPDVLLARASVGG